MQANEAAVEGKEDHGVQVTKDYVSSLEQQNYLLQTEVEYARALMNEEPELGTTMDDQIDRFKRSHAAQIRRYDLKMRKMKNRNTELEAQLASLTRAHYLLQETNRNTKEKLEKVQATADTVKLGKLSFEIGRDQRVRELSGEVMSLKALLEKSQLAKSEMESECELKCTLSLRPTSAFFTSVCILISLRPDPYSALYFLSYFPDSDAAAKESMKHNISRFSSETEQTSNKLMSANARLHDFEAKNTVLSEQLDA